MVSRLQCVISRRLFETDPSGRNAMWQPTVPWSPYVMTPFACIITGVECEAKIMSMVDVVVLVNIHYS